MKSKFPQYYRSTEGTEENAQKLRKPLTPAEKIFWHCARNRGLLNLKFRRQHPIGPFIADFYCHEYKLVVEIDGDIHSNEEIRSYDLKRDLYMKNLGLSILRFSNDDVFKNMDWIEEQIKQHIAL